MRVIFIGSSKFGKKCLETIMTLQEVDVVGVVTAPRQFSISYNKDGVTNVLHADVTSLCEQHNLDSVMISDGMRDESLYKQVEAWRPDAFIVAGWYHMIPKKWRDMAPAYGLHASLLPDYSGGAPLVWAMINGETKTGITLFQFDGGVDSGPILGQRETPITNQDTIATLYAHIEELGLELLSECIPKLAAGSAKFTIQDESKRRMVPQRKPEDGFIDWNWPSAQIHNFVRAQTKPYPGAYTVIDGRKVSIWAGMPTDHPVDISMLANIGGDTVIGCSGGSYKITNISIDDLDAEPHELFSLSAPHRKTIS